MTRELFAAILSEHGAPPGCAEDCWRTFEADGTDPTTLEPGYLRSVASQAVELLQAVCPDWEIGTNHGRARGE